MSIDKLCNIKTYLPVKEKFDFVDEYRSLLNDHMADYQNYESFIAYIFFNLMVVKKYTDIDIQCTYEEYDILQENGVINKILEIIQEDYMILMKMVQTNNNNE